MSNRTRICAHCVENAAIHENALCETCVTLPRCEVCEVFFDGLVKQSEENPKRCDSCLHYEQLIKFECTICEKPIPLFVSKQSNVPHYVMKGNTCGVCGALARTESRLSQKEDEKHQFIGYLAIIERLYQAGVIGKDEWENAIKMNRHDVTSWDGIEELEEEEVTESDLLTTEA